MHGIQAYAPTVPGVSHMFRRLIAWLLRADWKPIIDWSEAEAGRVLCRISVDVPRVWSGREILEQVLCATGNEFVLYKKRRSGGELRVRFTGPFHGAAMRLTEFEPGPPPLYRLQLWPVDGEAVLYSHAWPGWFGVWRNESHNDLGVCLCYIDSGDRDQLKELRRELLGGKVPDSLITEEAMWEQVNGLPESDRRAAMAALAMRSLAAVDQRFHETFPDAGPVPESLRPAFDAIQQRIQDIQQAAESRPVAPELAALMQRFVSDSTKRSPAAPPEADSVQ